MRLNPYICVQVATLMALTSGTPPSRRLAHRRPAAASARLARATGAAHGSNARPPRVERPNLHPSSKKVNSCRKRSGRDFNKAKSTTETGLGLISVVKTTTEIGPDPISVVKTSTEIGLDPISVVKTTTEIGLGLISVVKTTTEIGPDLISVVKTTTGIGPDLISVVKTTTEIGPDLISVVKTTTEIGPDPIPVVKTTTEIGLDLFQECEPPTEIEPAPFLKYVRPLPRHVADHLPRGQPGIRQVQTSPRESVVEIQRPNFPSRQASRCVLTHTSISNEIRACSGSLTIVPILLRNPLRIQIIDSIFQGMCAPLPQRPRSNGHCSAVPPAAVSACRVLRTVLLRIRRTNHV